MLCNKRLVYVYAYLYIFIYSYLYKYVYHILVYIFTRTCIYFEYLHTYVYICAYDFIIVCGLRVFDLCVRACVCLRLRVCVRARTCLQAGAFSQLPEASRLELLDKTTATAFVPRDGSDKELLRRVQNLNRCVKLSKTYMHHTCIALWGGYD